MFFELLTQLYLSFDPIYKRKDLKEKLFPRLVEAQKASPLQMQKILMQRRHPQGVSAILALIGLLMYGVWLLLN